jgi:two-component system LytT family response regulator
MRTLKAMIVDDEAGNREYLEGLLRKQCPHIREILHAKSAHEGITHLEFHRPDVVFLDIEMPGGTGFDFLNDVREKKKLNFRIIFVTAYDAYALQAIKYSALDYLLKPVDPDELQVAIDKLSESTAQRDKLDVLSHNLSHDEDRRIALATQDEVVFVKVRDIIRLQAEANYTRVFIAEQDQLLLSGNLGHFEKLLTEQSFIRTHQSHLINSKQIKKYVKSEGGYLVMQDDSQVPIARMKKDEVMRKIS